MKLKFREWVEENLNEIKSPPHLPIPYFKNKLKKLESLIDSLKDFPKQCDKMLGFLEDFFGNSNYYTYFPHTLIDLIKPEYNYHQVIDNIKHFLTDDNTSMTRTYLVRSLPFGEDGTVQEFKERFSDFFDTVKFFRKRLPDLKEEFEDSKEYLKGGKHYDESDNFPSYESVMEMLDTLSKGFDLIEEFLSELGDYEKKTRAIINQIDRAMEKYYSGGEERFPAHKDYEILYHATVAGKDILRDGFKTRKELGKGALGGGPDDLISFTADPHIALAIARSLIDVIYISQGRYKINDLLRAGQAHNVDLTTTSQYRDWLRHQEKPESASDEYFLFQIFRIFLSLTNHRYNPWFAFVSIEDFQKFNVKDVAVLACKVDMTKEKSFLASMQEIRVPITSIKQCRNIPFQYYGIEHKEA